MPLMIRYPKEIKAGSVCSDIVCNVDIAPTFLDFAGITTPTYMQGRTFRSILGGNAPLDEISWLIIGTGCVMMQNTKRTHTTKCAIIGTSWSTGIMTICSSVERGQEARIVVSGSCLTVRRTARVVQLLCGSEVWGSRDRNDEIIGEEDDGDRGRSGP